MSVDANTIISTVVLGVSGWTLKTVVDLAKAQAAAVVERANQAERIDEARGKIEALAKGMEDLKVEMAGLRHARAHGR